MEKTQWFEVQMRIAPMLKDALVHQLFEWGAQGISEDDSGEETLVRAYFEEDKRDLVEDEIEPFIQTLAGFFPLAKQGAGATKVELNDVEDENWADAHKAFYPAQALTRLFFLKPAWDNTTEVPDGMVPLILEPGQAFGTGLHASTRLCIRLLEYFVEFHAKPGEIHALDVGTGTGILAMVLSKLGVAEVIATDNDPIALEVAQTNLEVNESTNVQLTDTPLEELEGEFSIIVSNILLETHRQLAAHYRRLLLPGGQIILSGLLGHQKTDIVEIMGEVGFQLEASESSQDWIALAFTKKSDLHTN
jgi:ribosomal protein L11 methyltransferase